MSINKVTRRNLMLTGGALGLSACVATRNFNELDHVSRQTRGRLFAQMPQAKQAAEDAAGHIVFPNIKKAGFLVGAWRGDGTLFSKNNVIGHYTVNGLSAGLQAGIQEFSMMLFFMTPEAMADFRSGRGLELGTEAEYALPKYGSVNFGASSATYNKPVYALIFNQEGVMLGASLRGAKYDAI